MLFKMGLRGVFRMLGRMGGVSPRRVRVMRRLFVVSGFVMFRGFGVVFRRVRMVFCGLFVMIGSFLGHELLSLGNSRVDQFSVIFEYDSSAKRRRPFDARSDRWTRTDRAPRIAARLHR